jgi:hypothetical protein
MRAPRPRPLHLGCWPSLALAIPLVACGPKTQAIPTVFDPAGATNAAATENTARGLEHAVPARDGSGADGEGWVGVSVLDGIVRFSHPSRWQIRDASLEKGHAFIRYVSPKAYSFALYERADGPGDWKSILGHYEADLAANGAEAIGGHVAMATVTNQGRAYTVDQKIESKEPVLSRSREILLQGEHHVVLVQIVTEEESLARISSEVLEILRQLEVL